MKKRVHPCCNSKQSIFITDMDGTCPPSINISSWNLGTDCCSWDGVQCNNHTGHVIALDLSSSCIHGSINSTTTLFHLIHLTHLNLSLNYFSGQIPPEIFLLSNLVSLDLSDSPLKHQNPGLKELVEKFPSLIELNLNGVNISSTVPQSFTNLSSTAARRRTLYEYRCGPIGSHPHSTGSVPFKPCNPRKNPPCNGCRNLHATDDESKNFTNFVASALGSAEAVAHQYHKETLYQAQQNLQIAASPQRLPRPLLLPPKRLPRPLLPPQQLPLSPPAAAAPPTASSSPAAAASPTASSPPAAAASPTAPSPPAAAAS